MTPNKLTETEASDRQRVGATIREFREMRGLKADQLANLVKISRPYLANIEAGRKPLTRVLLARISAALNVRQASIVPAGYFVDDQQVPA